MPKGSRYAAKRKQAEDLYCGHGFQQNEIAALLGVTEKTISAWKQQGDWELKRAAFTTTKSSELRRLYAQVAELNGVIHSKPTGERYATSAQADVLSKLAATIKSLEQDTGVAATVDVGMAFLDWMRTRVVDLKPLLAGKVSLQQLVTEEFDLYLKGLLR